MGEGCAYSYRRQRTSLENEKRHRSQQNLYIPMVTHLVSRNDFFTPFVNTNWHHLEELCMATHLEPDRRWGRLVSFFQGCQAPTKTTFPVFLNQQQQKYFSFYFNCIFFLVLVASSLCFPCLENGLPNFVCSGNPVFGLYITRTHTTQVTHTHTHAHTHAHRYTMFSLKPLFSAPVVGFGCWV